MTGEAATAVPWQDLLAGVAESSSDCLRLLLEIWAERRGLSAAAIYVDVPGGHRRSASVGDVELPEELAEAPEGWDALHLPGGLLLSRSGEIRDGDPDDGALRLALSQAVQVRRLEEEVRRQNFAESYRLVELEAVYEVGLAIASTLNLDELSEGVLLRAVSLSDARRGALYLVEDGRFRLQTTIGGDARNEMPLDDPQLPRLDGQSDDCQDVLPGASYALALPIEIEGAKRGLLAIGDKESRRGVGPFAEADRRTLGLFANQAAIALENAHLHRQALEKERLEREMELAAEIQRRLLPKEMPALDGFEIVGWNRPTWQVGGDYFDFLPLADGRLGLVVADVTGKGLAAALLVSTVHSALQLLFDSAAVDVDLLARLNEHIVHSSSPNKFITMILADLDPATGEIRSLNAGHNPGMLVRADGAISQLTPGGMPLGLLPGASYHAQTLQIEPGELLCLYSDGITECESLDEEEFGEQRLEELLLEQRDQPLADIMKHIERTMDDFARGRSQSDDQTVVLLRRTG